MFTKQKKGRKEKDTHKLIGCKVARGQETRVTFLLNKGRENIHCPKEII
jgi:hypothetical protein